MWWDKGKKVVQGSGNVKVGRVDIAVEEVVLDVIIKDRENLEKFISAGCMGYYTTQ